MTTLHPQVEELLATFRAAGGPAMWQLSPEEAREAASGMMALGGSGPQDVETEDVSIPGSGGEIAARIYTPQGATPTSVVVWFHGGGWVLGGIDGHDAVCRSIAAETGALVVNPDYRLAPEHRFPAAADDALSVVAWAAQEIAAGRPLIVGGDSAGANLAAVAALRARDGDGPEIAHQLLFYPVTDSDFSRPSYVAHEDSLPLSKKDMEFFWNHYVPDADNRNHPHVAPLRAASLAGLPPALVVVAGHDPLHDEGVAYAEALQAAGVAVDLVEHPDMPHGFLSFLAVFDTAQQAARDLGVYVRKVVG